MAPGTAFVARGAGSHHEIVIGSALLTFGLLAGGHPLYEVIHEVFLIEMSGGGSSHEDVVEPS